MWLLYSNALRQIPRLVDVAAAADGDVVGEQLQRDDLQDGEKEFVALGDGDDVFD